MFQLAKMVRASRAIANSIGRPRTGGRQMGSATSGGGSVAVRRASGALLILKPPCDFDVRPLRFTFLFAILEQRRANQLKANSELLHKLDSWMRKHEPKSCGV